ncbi:MAG TPA: NrsF family protein [Polyangiaceae bacterium]
MKEVELPSDLKARLLKQIEQKPAPTRRTEMFRASLLVAGSIAIGLVIFLVRGGIRMTGRPTSLIVGTSLGTALIAGVGTWMALGRRRSMLGRSSLALCVTALVTPLALLFWKVVWSSQYPGGLDPWPGRIGFRCLNLSLLMGVLPLVALLFARRGTDPTHPRLAGLSAGASVGLCVALFVDMWCPVGYVPHFLIGHILPIALLALAGLWFGKVLLPPRK